MPSYLATTGDDKVPRGRSRGIIEQGAGANVAQSSVPPLMMAVRGVTDGLADVSCILICIHAFISPARPYFPGVAAIAHQRPGRKTSQSHGEDLSHFDLAAKSYRLAG
jgi:hypothetical protein